jgi:hypothetical protein
MDAISRLIADNSELFLSLDEDDTAQKIVAITRLRATELPTPTSTEETYDILARILGELLAAGKIQIKNYGLSAVGLEEFNGLVGLINPPAPAISIVVDPRDEFSDIIAIYRGPAHIFNAKMKTEPFRTRFDGACAAGVI